MKLRKRIGRWLWVVGATLLFVSTVQELRKPKDQRTWHGRVLGCVPYDFRPPAADRLREAYWNPQNRHLFTERPLGIGWAVNLYEVYRRLGGAGCPQPDITIAAPAAA